MPLYYTTLLANKNASLILVVSYRLYYWLYLNSLDKTFKEDLVIPLCPTFHSIYSVVSIKRTGSLNYFEVFYHPELFFHALNEIFLPPWSFFHALNEIFAPPCLLITSCSLNRYYRVVWQNHEIATFEYWYFSLFWHKNAKLYTWPSIISSSGQVLLKKKKCQLEKYRTYYSFLHSLAESFCYVNYGSSIITSLRNFWRTFDGIIDYP